MNPRLRINPVYKQNVFLKQTVAAASMSALDATERALEDEQMGFHVDTTPRCQVSHAELRSPDLRVHGMGWDG